MLYTISAMADQVGECNANSTPFLKNAVSVKEEVCQDGDFADEKIHISETAVNTHNAKLQDHLTCDKMKHNIKTELVLTKVEYDTIHNNLKIEDGIGADEMKIDGNRRLLYCEDCQAYCEDYCAQCGMLVHVMNKTVPVDADNRLLEELPHDNILEIRDYFGQFRIYALKVIPIGVRFGPFTGINTAERPWKIKGGTFVVDKDKSKCLNWMWYINPARNISERNLRVLQHEHNLYYESTCQIEEGNELLVHFGEEYEDSLNRNIEMDFIPTTNHTLKDAFACTFCCLGFSSRSYLSKHKTVCPGNAIGGFSIEELTQCPTCKIHLDQKEYITQHMPYCCERKDRKYDLSTSGNRATEANRRKTRPHQIYKCQQCKYRTKYKGDFKNHTSQHYEVKVYKCGVCCRRFKTKEVLRLHTKNADTCAGGKEDSEHSIEVYVNAHIKAEHSCSRDEVKQFKCSLCEFRSKYKVGIKKHTKVKHSEEFKYKCDSCDYKTNFQICLKAHIETRHLKQFKYKCDICDYKTSFKFSLNRHIKTKHLKEFKYKCGTCDYKTDQKTHLKTHIRTRHLKEFKYECGTCDYKTNVQSVLKIHVETQHLKEFKYKCDICEYKTNQKFHFKTHIETRHLKEFKYKCDICDYKTNWKSQLKTHIETIHLKEFKFKCDLCDYKTNWMSNLKTHTEAKHSKESKYRCDTCDYKANSKTHLKCHIQTKHLKEFKYKCDTCDYKTNRNSQLKSHVDRRHLKVFKYRCDSCDYETSTKSNLTVHVKSKHLKEFSYKCEICDYKTNVMPNLRRHCSSHIKIAANVLTGVVE